MILTGDKIFEEVKNGNITITPFDEKRINPNSYNLSLSNKLIVYADNMVQRIDNGVVTAFPILKEPIDMKKNNPCREIIIPDNGLLLEPGRVYLGKTNEYTATNKYVPLLEGRSSIGRLGIFIHVSAGFGDIGYAGNWTLELMVAQPVVIYPNVEICQIYYHTVDGTTNRQYTSGKYSNITEVQPSLLYKELTTE